MQDKEQSAIARLKDGDIQGLETLVKGYQIQALRAAYLVTQDHSLAEDIVQSAFINLQAKIHQFDPTRPFRPWFLRSVVNAAINAARRRQRLVPFEDATKGEREKALEWLNGANPEPEEALEAAQLRQEVWNALEQLTPNQRAAVVLRYYLEMSEAEMGETLASPISSVKWWLYSARKRLRGLLDPLRSAKE